MKSCNYRNKAENQICYTWFTILTLFLFIAGNWWQIAVTNEEEWCVNWTIFKIGSSSKNLHAHTETTNNGLPIDRHICTIFFYNKEHIGGSRSKCSSGGWGMFEKRQIYTRIFSRFWHDARNVYPESSPPPPASGKSTKVDSCHCTCDVTLNRTHHSYVVVMVRDWLPWIYIILRQPEWWN